MQLSKNKTRIYPAVRRIFIIQILALQGKKTSFFLLKNSVKYECGYISTLKPVYETQIA